MAKFSNYMRGCKDCLDLVDNAVSRGVVLSKEERFDNYFKTLLFYREDLKRVMSSKLYRVASFYSHAFLEMKKVEVGGYDNKSAYSSFKKLNKLSLIYNGKCGTDLISYDEDGTLYVAVEDFDKKGYEIIYSINDRDSLIKCLCDFAQYLVSNSRNSNTFINTYLGGVVSDVYDEVAPTPYSNVSESQTLGYVLSENGISTRVPYLRILDGNANEGNKNMVFTNEDSVEDLVGAL